MDRVFKALADPVRRRLLDKLHERNGQAVGELCEAEEISRQAISKHLELLEEANLVTSVRQGRERIYSFNPVPIREIAERWIRKFEEARLGSLIALKHRMEQGDE